MGAHLRARKSKCLQRLVATVLRGMMYNYKVGLPQTEIGGANPIR